MRFQSIVDAYGIGYGYSYTPPSVSAVVTHDAFASGTVDTGDDTTHSTNITVGSNSNRAIFALVSWVDAIAGTASVNGVSSDVDGAFTAVGSSSSTTSGHGAASDMGVQWWRLLNPTAGAHTITVTMSENTQVKMLQLYALYNVNQTTPAGTPATGTSTGGTVTVNVPSAAGDHCLLGHVFATNVAANAQTVLGTEDGSLTENTLWNSGAKALSRNGDGDITTFVVEVNGVALAYSGIAVKSA